VSQQLIFSLLVLTYAGALLLAPKAMALGLLFPAVWFFILTLFTALDVFVSGIKLFVARAAFCVAVHAPASLGVVLISQGR
jgi:hypothetical protein